MRKSARQNCVHTKDGLGFFFFIHLPTSTANARCVNTHKRKSCFLYSFYLNRLDFLPSIYFFKARKRFFLKEILFERERLFCCCCCWKLFSPFPLFLFFHRIVFYLLVVVVAVFVARAMQCGATLNPVVH